MRQVLTLDSSQISTFLHCDYKWYYGYEKSIESIPSFPSKSNDREMGHLGHKYLELYYSQRALGESINNSAEFALASKHDSIISPKEISEVKTAFNRYIMMYSHNNDVEVMMGRPLRVPQFATNGEYLTDAIELNPLVEKGFSYPLLDTPDYLFILEGRIDLCANSNGTPCFMDHKFQSREGKLYKQSIQFRNYALATGFRLGIINYIRFHKELSEKTFLRTPISFGMGFHQWWKAELIGIFHRINHKMKSGTFERRWNACGGEYGKTWCQFTQLCEERNESVRDNIEKQFYQIKEKWSPW